MTTPPPLNSRASNESPVSMCGSPFPPSTVHRPCRALSPRSPGIQTDGRPDPDSRVRWGDETPAAEEDARMNPLDPYPSPEARDAELASLVARMGGEVRRYGSSVEGRPLLAGRIPAITTLPSPARVLVAANIHGPEYVSCAVAL